MMNQVVVPSRMLQFLSLVLLLVGCPQLLLAQQASAELDITPDTFYALEFEVTGLKAPVQSSVEMTDAHGMVHHDGVRVDQELRLTPDQSSYSFYFLSASQANRLKLIVPDSGAKISGVNLKPIQPQGMVLNGDLSLPGLAGWPVRSNFVERVTHEDKQAIRINTSNYVLSEFVPIKGGSGFRLTKGSHGWPGVTLLAYDQNKHLISKVANNHRVKPPITTPAEAAYFRIVLHTSHLHIPTHATIHFPGLGLELQTEGTAAAARPASWAKDAFAEIILAPGSDGREENAARELQHWIQQITGVTPPVLARPSQINRLKLHVGMALAEGFEADRKALADTDGFAVRRKGNNIYVFGGSSRGTLYGVYQLLEKNTDIIWPRPGAGVEVIHGRQSTIEFKQADFLSKPAFEKRFISNAYRGSDAYIFQRWLARNGLDTPQAIHVGFDYIDWIYGSRVGSSSSFISWARPGEETKDLYPLVDGVRDVSRWRQPCYTHPKLVERIADHIRERYETLRKAGIEADYLHVTLADNWTVCNCDRCMTPITLEDGSVLKPKAAYSVNDPLFFSTRTFIMLNAVAENLSRDMPEKFPKIKIGTHAYIFTAEPPAVKIHPMIIPEFAAYPTQNLRYPVMAGKGNVISVYDKEIWKRRFTQWAQRGDALGYFGYYYPLGFNAVADAAEQDYRDLLKAGGVQAHTEGFPEDTAELTLWDYDAIEKWSIARLMWDPSQTAEDLRKYYIARVYREAAPQMTQFYKLVRDAWHAPSDEVFINCHTNPQTLYEEFVLKQGLEDKLRQTLVAAQQAAKHPASKRMIDRKLAQFDNLKQRFGQHGIPRVEESKHEWLEATSPHWEKALVFNKFLLVDDWRLQKRNPAEQEAAVSLMHDRQNLYVKFVAYDKDLSSLVMPAQGGVGVFPQGDRMELMLRTPGKKVYFFAAGPNGTLFSHPKVESKVVNARTEKGDAWIAIIAIPLAEIGITGEETAMELQVGRVYRRDPAVTWESTLSGASMFNKSDTFWTKIGLDR